MRARVLALLVLAVLVSGQPAFADMSRDVIAAFRGQLVVSKDELPEGKNAKDAIAKIKAAHLKQLTGEQNQNVVSWRFHYTAFLTKTGAKTLKLNFLRGGKIAANKRLDGIDPKSAVLSGDISISEDEGLARGTTYTLELVDGGKAVVAKTTLTLK